MKHLIVTVAVLLLCTMAGSTDLSVSQASNHFASLLYQELAKTPGNVLVCPVSVHIALALVHQGAGGTTRSELAKVLGLTDSNIDIKNSYKTLLTGLQDDVLKIATKLYPANSFKPKPEYVTVAQQYFLSDVEPLDYGKNVEAANIINKFVENKTNNKIHDIINPDSLTDLTRFVIVNAVHFKARWASTFPPAFPDNFKVTPSQSIRTEFLGQSDFFPFKEDPALGAKILKMDYEGGKYSMVFVLPNKEDGLPELEAKLATTSMDSLLSGLNVTRVEVQVPKFKLELEMQLKDTLVQMGITHMFDTRADLSNVAEGENLYVSSVIQKTFIDVNEEGTEAAAATGFVTPLSGGSEDNTFIAKRPFLFYLINNETPVILFNGKLVKPQEISKTLPNMSSHKPTDKEEGNSNLNVGIDGDFNRFGNEQGTYSHNQGIGMNPSNGQGQNLIQPNLPQNFGQTGPNNRFDQNKYPKPPTPQSNYGQNNQHIFGHSQNVDQQNLPPNYVQNSQPAPEYNQRPFYQTGHLNRGQNVQPLAQQTFAPNLHYGIQPTGPQYSNADQQPSAYPHQSNYQPWHLTYGY